MQSSSWGRLTDTSEIIIGVWQEWLLSPLLFLQTTDWIKKTIITTTRHGIQWVLTVRYEDLDFAGDTAITAANESSYKKWWL